MTPPARGLVALEGLADRLLPSSIPARAVTITALLMGFYAVFNAWAMHVAGPYDFPDYYLAAVLFLDGRMPYGMDAREFYAIGIERMGMERFAYPYYYPPLVAVLVAPLTLLSVNAAAWVWNMANAAAVVGGTALLLGDRRWKREGLAVWALTAAFVPTLATLYAGQVGGLLYLCVAASIAAHERGRLALAGAAVAFGAALKVVPVVLVGYFAWRGDWRAVAGCLLGAAAIVLATAPVAGFDGWLAYFTSGLSMMHSPDIVTNPSNFTLNGLFLRLLKEGSAAAPLVAAPDLVRPLWIGSGILVVLATVAACWPPFRRARSMRLEVATILVALQLVAPYTWYHQLTASVLPAAVVILMAWRAGGLGERWLWGLVAMLVAVDAFGLAWHRFETSAVLLSVPVLAVAALWAALCLAAMRRDGWTVSERE